MKPERLPNENLRTQRLKTSVSEPSEFKIKWTSHDKKNLAGQITRLKIIMSISILLFSGCATHKPGKAVQRKLAGKNVVIVGASSGFGRGVAEQLGKYQANGVLAARRTDLLKEVADQISASGGTAIVVPTDISKPEDVLRLADSAVARYGKIDVWINMSGVGAIGRFWEIPLADQARIVDVNLKGIIYASHAATQVL